MDSSPHRWEIPWLLAYDLYTYWGKYKEAGEFMVKAADLADLGQRADGRFVPPKYLRDLGARLLAQSGSVDTAIETTRLAVAGATDDQARAELEARLQALFLDKELQSLNALAAQRTLAGAPATSITQLTSGSELDGLTDDPYGDPFFLDAQGRAQSKNQKKLLRLYIHPGEPAIERAAD